LHFTLSKRRGSAVGIAVGCGLDSQEIRVLVPIWTRMFIPANRLNTL
jgi:hypothetical protein